MSGKSRGRPSKLPELTTEQLDELHALIRAGATGETAAASVGVARRTFYDWLKRDEELRASVEQARARSEATLVARIAKAASAGSWGAAAWMLERRFPERWIKPTELPPAPAEPEPEEADPLGEVIDLAKRRTRRRR